MGNSLQPHGQQVQDNEANIAAIEAVVTATGEATCEICTDPLPPRSVFKNNNRCVHPFCLDCMAEYVKFQIQENAGNISCPAWRCRQRLDPMCCRPIISEDLFDKWCDALCVSALPVQHRCYCPYEACSALIINECEAESVRKVQCPNCKKHFCFKCQVPWHEGNRCEESQRDRHDAMFEKLVRRKRWRRCYNCGRCVERVTGCETIRCRCGACFCYTCGEQHGSSPCPVQNIKQRTVCCVSVCVAVLAIMAAVIVLVEILFKRNVI